MFFVRAETPQKLPTHTVYKEYNLIILILPIEKLYITKAVLAPNVAFAPFCQKQPHRVIDSRSSVASDGQPELG